MAFTTLVASPIVTAITHCADGIGRLGFCLPHRYPKAAFCQPRPATGCACERMQGRRRRVALEAKTGSGRCGIQPLSLLRAEQVLKFKKEGLL